jgi:hypothetical protein
MDNISDMIAFAKERAKAEKEINAERWVVITLCTYINKERIVLHRYDIPTSFLERWNWLIDWRRSALICKYPKQGVRTECCYYYKITGVNVQNFSKCVSSLSALKARITIQEKEIERYIASNKDNLFFNEDSDEVLVRVRKKLQRAKDKYNDALKALELKVNEYKQ